MCLGPVCCTLRDSPVLGTHKSSHSAMLFQAPQVSKAPGVVRMGDVGVWHSLQKVPAGSPPQRDAAHTP